MCNARFCTTQEDPRPGFMGGEAEQRASERGRILSSRWAWGLARDQLSAAKPCAGRGTLTVLGWREAKGGWPRKEDLQRREDNSESYLQEQ